MENTRLSATLKEYRNKAGLTQQELADILGIKRSAYAYYEIGKTTPNIQTLIDIAKIYKISLDSLISDKRLELSDSTSDEFQGVRVDDAFNELSDLEKAMVFKFRLMSAKEKKELIDKLFNTQE